MRNSSCLLGESDLAASWHLRISVTAACNLKCIYCNPLGCHQNENHLQSGAFKLFLRAGMENGIKRVHWTGGEPGMIDLESLVTFAAEIGYEQQIVTTNGTLLAERIDNLINCGISRVNVSIDSLSTACYQQMTGGDGLREALYVVHVCSRRLETPTKINVVVTSLNLSELAALVRLAQSINETEYVTGGVVLKLIELCPNNPVYLNQDNLPSMDSLHVSRAQIIAELSKSGSLQPTFVVGDNPNCDYFLVGNTGVSVGLVTMPSLLYPCGKKRCRKLRINPWGLMGGCITHPEDAPPPLEQDTITMRMFEIMKWREANDGELEFEKCHFQGQFGLWRFGLCKGT